MAEEGESSKMNMLKISDEESPKTITLKSSDDDIFEVESFIAKQMQTVQSFIDDADGDDTVIPLPNVSSAELARVIDYCRAHHRITGDDLKEFDKQFLQAMNDDELKLLILAANYLNTKDLLDFLAQGIADSIENKSVEFVRKLFGIENDYTPEEEAKLREDHAWAFEGVAPIE